MAIKAHSHQRVYVRRATDVDGRRRAWCEWALTVIRLLIVIDKLIWEEENNTDQVSAIRLL